MTIIGAIAPDALGEIERVSFGYWVGVDDPPEIAVAIHKAGGRRVISWADAFPALDALGSKRAANIVIHTTRGAMTLEHNGRDWMARISWP